MTLAEFEQAIMAYRKAHSLSQDELGKICGVSGPTISCIECGKNSRGAAYLPLQKTVDRIQRVLCITDNIDITPPTRKEPTMNNSEIDARNTAKLRAILLALLNEVDAPETTPAAVTPPPLPPRSRSRSRSRSCPTASAWTSATTRRTSSSPSWTETARSSPGGRTSATTATRMIR